MPLIINLETCTSETQRLLAEALMTDLSDRLPYSSRIDFYTTDESRQDTRLMIVHNNPERDNRSLYVWEEEHWKLFGTEDILVGRLYNEGNNIPYSKEDY